MPRLCAVADAPALATTALVTTALASSVGTAATAAAQPTTHLSAPIASATAATTLTASALTAAGFAAASALAAVQLLESMRVQDEPHLLRLRLPLRWQAAGDLRLSSSPRLRVRWLLPRPLAALHTA